MNEAELLAALRTIPDIHVQQVELGTLPIKEVVLLLEKTSLFLGYHGAGFDNMVFLPRGAAVLEILPKGTAHSPLYPSLAHRTGKTFTRYVNNNDTRQDNLGHYARLEVDVDAVLKLVKAMLRVQAAAMMRYSFDDNV
ncbi:hypothetical protein OEZ85_012014 [Tetradesmus obliquus]|uniref:Glycosyltransferase 61 catalytic domain-containing protein n=1 Tax=Tetradesmus obliquus TaxID=3088 RepID=A0ABY8TS35_TETOB|nr:hypothetical protein OEZ85_012014 [Tetradesmus obliquus]